MSAPQQFCFDMAVPETPKRSAVDIAVSLARRGGASDMEAREFLQRQYQQAETAARAEFADFLRRHERSFPNAPRPVFKASASMNTATRALDALRTSAGSF